MRGLWGRVMFLDLKVSTPFTKWLLLLTDGFIIEPNLPPVKPNLSILNIDLIGMIYTTKLAFHYFRRQPIDKSRDRCWNLVLLLISICHLPYPLFPFLSIHPTCYTLWMKPKLIKHRYVRTPSMPESIQEHLDGQGVGSATVKVSCKAMLKIASDASIKGLSFRPLSLLLFLTPFFLVHTQDLTCTFFHHVFRE